jgi:bifunctional N-acetylglucosamine-1-phosphate-uridyltransferase/glucosamine-1-phosphate-acetyltransferase GlmU-like protein
MQTQIVILAAGKGKRASHKNLPKVLLPLHGKPLLCHLLDEIETLGKTVHPVIVVGYKHGQVMEALGKQYTYAIQREQLGTAHAVWSAREKIKAHNILVLYGDMPFIKAKSLEKIIHSHQNKKAVVSMFTTRVPNFSGKFSVFKDYGRIIRDNFNQIVKSVEVKDARPAELKISEVNPCIYIFNTEWLWNHIDEIQTDNVQHEFYLTDIVEVAIREGHQINSLPIDPKEVMGINTLAQLKLAEAMQ